MRIKYNKSRSIAINRNINIYLNRFLFHTYISILNFPFVFGGQQKECN